MVFGTGELTSCVLGPFGMCAAVDVTGYFPGDYVFSWEGAHSNLMASVTKRGSRIEGSPRLLRPSTLNSSRAQYYTHPEQGLNKLQIPNLVGSLFSGGGGWYDLGYSTGLYDKWPYLDFQGNEFRAVSHTIAVARHRHNPQVP